MGRLDPVRMFNIPFSSGRGLAALRGMRLIGDYGKVLACCVDLRLSIPSSPASKVPER